MNRRSMRFLLGGSLALLLVVALALLVRSSGSAGAGSIPDQVPRAGIDGETIARAPQSGLPELDNRTAEPEERAVAPSIAPPADGPRGLSGFVVDAYHESGLERARVVVASAAGSRVEAKAWTLTDVNGAFHIERIPDGRLLVEATLVDYARTTIAWDPVTRSADDPVVIAMPRAARVTGVVLDTEDRAVGGVAVGIVDRAFDPAAGDAGDELRSLEKARRTNAGGRFEITAGPLQERSEGFRVAALHPASPLWLSDVIQAQPGEVVELVIRLSAGVTVEGTVTAQGEPALAVLRFIDRSRKGRFVNVRTDAAGRYSAQGLTPGLHEISIVRAEDWESGGTIATRELKIPEGVDRVRADLEIGGDPRVQVVGRILRQGVAMAGAQVSCVSHRPGEAIGSSGLRQTDRDGRFTVRTPPGAASIMVVASPGPSRLDPDAPPEARTFAVVIPDVANRHELVLEWPSAAVTGRLVGGHAAGPAGGTAIRLAPLASGNGSVAGSFAAIALQTTTGADGSFRFDSVEEGRYALVVRGEVADRLLVSDIDVPAHSPVDLGDLSLNEDGLAGFVQIEGEAGRVPQRAEVWVVRDGRPQLRIARWFGRPVEIEIDGAQASRTSLAVCAEGYATRVVPAADVEGTTRDEPRAIQLDRGGTLHVHGAATSKAKAIRLTSDADPVLLLRRGRLDATFPVSDTPLVLPNVPTGEITISWVHVPEGDTGSVGAPVTARVQLDEVTIVKP